MKFHHFSLADSLKKAQNWLLKKSTLKPVLFLAGLLATLWFLVRVIPKPSRAGYPCMRAAAPLASGFVLYLMGLFSTTVLFKMSKKYYLKSRHFMASLFLLAAICAGIVTTLTADKPAYANNLAFSQPVNAPMGTAKGIYPGRVVWIHNPDATNENCTNKYGDGWFLNKNNNQDTIDRMVSLAIQLLTGENTDRKSWDALFRYYNENHGYGSLGYTAREKILIKTNATSGWGGNFKTTDLSKVNNQYYAVAETSPQMVLSVLRQLVNVVGVAQADIYVGDPMKHIYKHCYDIWHSEFPDVNYLDHDDYRRLGRVQAAQSSDPLIFYSDKGSVMNVQSDKLYKVFEDVSYIINLPALKGHARAGITLFAKNHFGSHCRNDAFHLHNGLVDPNESGNIRSLNGSYYGLYRVQVDLMGHELLCGKELVYLLDGLWAGSEAIDPPTKWESAPFNSDWTSSVFASQDPVAIESVAFDFLRTEYTAANHPGLDYPQMNGVDDYLHQAADAANWPVGITYDPENDGTPLGSLGVHEHWNNAVNKQYSRNLGMNKGIELIQIPGTVVSEPVIHLKPDLSFTAYPNPFRDMLALSFQLDKPAEINLAVYNIEGKMVKSLKNELLQAGNHQVHWSSASGDLPPGTYFLRLSGKQGSQSFYESKKIQKIK